MSVPEPVPVAPPVPESVPVTTPNTAKSPPVQPGKAVAVATGAAITHNVGKVPQPDVDMDLHEKRRQRSGCFYESIGQQFGRYYCHAEYATSLSGVTREVRIATPEIRYCRL